MKSGLFGLTLTLLVPLSAPAWSGNTWGPITRAAIKSNADLMIDSTWVAKTGFSNFQVGSTYQAYTGGVVYRGIAYSQNNPQENWAEFGNLVTNTAGGSVGYGNDCSGFVSICWKLPGRKTTSSFESQLGTYWTSLGDIGSSASVTLLPGDGINRAANHIIMFLNYEGTGIRSMEQTPDNAQRRTWSYSGLTNYRPIRRMQIDEVAMPDPPVIKSDLVSRVVDPGSPLTLSISATGTNLTFRWYLDGRLLTGANTNQLWLGAAQITNAGVYACVVSNVHGMTTGRVASVSIAQPQTTVFLDTFDTDTSAEWVITSSSEDTGVTFNWDYSGMGIPSAPSSTNGTTRGVRMEANMSLGAVAALSMSPAARVFAGDCRLRFDMWINANGPFPDGGTGSTESLTAGIGTAGDRVHWNGAGSSADGCWFLANSEGGAGDASSATGDYCAFVGPTLQNPSAGCYTAGTGSSARGNNHSYYTAAFPSGSSAPPAQKAAYAQQSGALQPGTVGMAWRDVIVARRGSTVEWIIDGVLMATITNATFTASNVFVGYWDSYASISDNPALSFGLVDNVRVQANACAPVLGIRPAQGELRLEASCSPGHYVLEFSPDFTSWTAVTNFVTAGGPFEHPLGAGAPRAFYRIRVLP